MSQISGVIIALNEERLIQRAVRNMRPWVDELIVLDGGSTDRTVQKAQAAGALPFYRRFNRDFGDQKSFAISLCTSPWIFLLDADETCEESIWRGLRELSLSKDNVDIFGFSRKNTYSDDEEPTPSLGLVNWPDVQFRFFRDYVRFQGSLHESPVGWRKAHHFLDRSIIHHKARSRQKREDDLYFSMRPQDYPERLARGEVPSLAA